MGSTKDRRKYSLGGIIFYLPDKEQIPKKFANLDKLLKLDRVIGWKADGRPDFGFLEL
jgi:hypothetical protein